MDQAYEGRLTAVACYTITPVKVSGQFTIVRSGNDLLRGTRTHNLKISSCNVRYDSGHAIEVLRATIAPAGRLAIVQSNAESLRRVRIELTADSGDVIGQHAFWYNMYTTTRAAARLALAEASG